jgi:hypothetical protein
MANERVAMTSAAAPGGKKGAAANREGKGQAPLTRWGASSSSKLTVPGSKGTCETVDSKPIENDPSADAERAVHIFHETVRQVLRDQRAASQFVALAVTVLAEPDYAAVAVGESNMLLHIPQAAFNHGMNLIMTQGNHPACCLGHRVVSPLESVGRLMSAAPSERGARTAAKVLTLLACYKWLVRFPLRLQMQLVSQAELHVFQEDELLYRQVRYTQSCSILFHSSVGHNGSSLDGLMVCGGIQCLLVTYAAHVLYTPC